MRDVLQVLKEQFANWGLIYQLANYDIKSTYQMHYLGAIWQFLNPIIQVAAFWFVFGVGIRRGQPVGDVPFIIWLVVSIVPWFFINSSINQGTKSIHNKVNLVSKMKFPFSILPSVIIVKNAYNFIVMFAIVIILLISNDIYPSIYWIQLPYYLVTLIIFLFAVTLLFATISILIRDIQTAINSVMRMFFFLTPIFWVADGLPDKLVSLLKLNPFYYLIEGFRNTLFLETWFYEDITYTIYFWGLTLMILLLGSFIHIKFKAKFVDYL
ncbi:ABC transporter permease [Oceanobacillus caeni]